MAQVLLDSDIEVNAQNAQGGTALMIAAARGNKEMIALLMDRGAKPQIKDNTGKDALAWTMGHGRKDVRELLAAAAPRQN